MAAYASGGAEKASLASRLGRIAVIGGGKMGEAIVSGLVNVANINTSEVFVAEPGAGRRSSLQEEYGIACLEDGRLIERPKTAILAVKPQVLRDVAAQLAESSCFAPQRVISIAAGVPTTVIQALFPQASVVRVMPNVALMVGAGMSVVAGAAGTPDAEVELTCELFSCMGEAVAIEEDLIDAATAVSGSGPAYFALLARELSRAGARAGLDPELAALLSRQTLVGASRYLDDTGLQPDHLMGAVTSPGGTTQAALQSLEQSGFPAAVSAAVTAAIARAKELA